jgi:hypothetical protein
VTGAGGDELAAILAALTVAGAREGQAQTAAATVAPWTMAMRLPDVEMEDLLALGRGEASCSIRF